MAHLPMIDALVQRVARRHRLPRHDAEEFGSIVRLRLIENDYSIIRRFRGASSLHTFLTVVVARLYLVFDEFPEGRATPHADASAAHAIAKPLFSDLNRRLPVD